MTNRSFIESSKNSKLVTSDKKKTRRVWCVCVNGSLPIDSFCVILVCHHQHLMNVIIRRYVLLLLNTFVIVVSIIIDILCCVYSLLYSLCCCLYKIENSMFLMQCPPFTMSTTTTAMAAATAMAVND